MVQRWLRAPIFHEEFHCPHCDDTVDVYGDHCLVCACGGDRTKRHNLLRNEVYYTCHSVGLAPELERPGLLQPRPVVDEAQENGAPVTNSQLRRPADVYIPRWRLGAPAAVDLAVTSGLRTDMVARSLASGSAATQAYEDFKREHLNTEHLCHEEGITFIPLIAEADGGGWGPAAHKFFNELAKVKSTLTGESREVSLHHLHQGLGTLLHRENARAVLKRFRTFTHNLEDIVAAATTLAAAAADIT